MYENVHPNLALSNALRWNAGKVHCVCGRAFEKLGRIIDLVRVVDYKIHKYIASSAVQSLTDLNLIVVGRSCR